MTPFLAEEAKSRLVEAVKKVESKTAAELVVCVRARSSLYRDVDVLVGAGLAFVVLLALLFDPIELDERHFPIDVLVAFAVGAFVSRALVGPRLASRARRRAEVEKGAKVELVTQNVTATRRRVGVLVYASAAERMVEIVSDIGISREALGADLDSARASCESAFVAGDVGAFTAALEKLGEGLAKALPREADDVNELPDEVS